MGVLAPVSAHAGLSAQPPIGTSGNFPACVFAESPSNISHNPSEVISEVSEVYNDFLNFCPTHSAGGEGGHQHFFCIGILTIK